MTQVATKIQTETHTTALRVPSADGTDSHFVCSCGHETDSMVTHYWHKKEAK